ncbi:lysine-rich nucleolar protein 1-like [Plakobranchus ocellatus]|uniref:Lysine-rich nucleolar protein 1-like n=1 Tax=Plakobranchus ocellatus TaxID=259542 RepID=A0AAV4E0B1_9GAST|nr:lysine-rich nucleolar protein 1-like [Plakobranchus ocellatus]
MNDQAMGNIEKSKKNKKRKHHESDTKDSEDTSSRSKKKKRSDHEPVDFDTGASLPKASFTEAIEEFSEKYKGGKRKKHKKKRSSKEKGCSEIEQTQKRESCGELKPQGHDIDTSVACDGNDLKKSKKTKKHKKKKEGKEHVVENEVPLGHDKNRDKVLCVNEIVKHGSSHEDKSVERSGEKEAKKKNKIKIIGGGEESEILVSDKKRKKKKKNETDNNVDCEENHVLVSAKKATNKNETEIDSNNEVNKVFGKKAKKKYESENNVDYEESKILVHNSKQKKKKKKKSEFESCGECNCEKNPELGSDKKKRKKKKGQNHDDLTFEKTELCNKRDKNKHKYISNDNCELKLSHAEEPTQSNSGIKKKCKKDQNENINAMSEEQNAEQQRVSKKSKSEAAESISSNHSFKTVAAASVDSLVDANQLTTGQWQGDLFHDADRQNKFLRLLGGRKKDSSASGAFKSSKLFKDYSAAPKKGLFGSLAPRVGGGNALSLSDAARLNERLEEDYNKALNLRLNTKKGTGFGFVPDPAEGKKFHIDINETKSIKFDD